MDTSDDGEPDDGRHEFDFIFGAWEIANRKLRDPGDRRCDDWMMFKTTSHTEPVLGGLSHLERIHAGPDTPHGPWEGLTLRQFDPRDRVWRIWWASTRKPGRLDPPLSGTFSDGVGVFTGEDTLDGVPIGVRFHWRHPGLGRAQWTQEFSWDDGASWHLNWVMDFRRITRLGG